MLFRRCVIITVLICLLCGLSLPVCAEETASALEQSIIDACTYRRSVDISRHSVSTSDFEACFDALCDDGKLPWYVDQSYAYTYDEDTAEMDTFTPSVLYDGALDMALYEQQAAIILQQCVLPGMDHLQIALAIHDYLVANTAYDETLARNTCYDVLTAGTAVCSGYALAYQDLLLRAGVPCRYVVSEEMEHAWNLVCIDGNWYHVDLTWDDPSPDLVGYVSHDYFMLTDQEIASAEEPHYNWDTDISCTDTRFSDAFWRDIYSAICYVSSDTCYLLRSDDYTNHIYRRDVASGKETLLYKESKNYIDLGYGNYKYEHQGLSYRASRLYFNSLDKVYSMKTDGSNRKTEYTHSGNTYVYGCHATEDMLHLSVMTHDADGTYQQLPLTASTEHTHSFTTSVQAPTCTADGYTLSQCDCGLSCQSEPVEATGHSQLYIEGKDATLFAAGYGVYTCEDCGDSYTETYPQLSIGQFAQKNAAILAAAGALVICLVRWIVVAAKKRKS